MEQDQQQQNAAAVVEGGDAEDGGDWETDEEPMEQSAFEGQVPDAGDSNN